MNFQNFRAVYIHVGRTSAKAPVARQHGGQYFRFVLVSPCSALILAHLLTSFYLQNCFTKKRELQDFRYVF